MKKAVMFLAAIASCALTTDAATVVPVAGVTGHDGGNWPATLGHLTDMVNALNPGWATADHNTGMDTSADPSDPSAWTYAGTNWQQEWLANSILDSSTSSNAKIGWAVVDFGGTVADLESMYLWNNNSTNPGEHTDTYNVYYATSPTVALPAMPNSRSAIGDYDFASGGWTLLNTGGALTLPRDNTNGVGPQAVVGLGGISAQYIGIEILTAGGPVTRVGLAQVEFTAIPEPSAVALLGLVGFTLLRRHRN